MDGVQLPQGQSHFEEAGLLFTTKFPEITGTHFIDLGRMKGWVDLGHTQWFWTRDAWIGNPAPYYSYMKIVNILNIDLPNIKVQ